MSGDLPPPVGDIRRPDRKSPCHRTTDGRRTGLANYEASEQPSGDEYDGTRISTGSDYIDKVMRGGIPLGSVTLIEGPSGSGKSVLCQHIVAGALMADLLVAYYTNGDAAPVADNMIALGLDISQDVESEQLRFFPLSEFGDWRNDPSQLFGPLKEHINERIGEGVDLVVQPSRGEESAKSRAYTEQHDLFPSKSGAWREHEHQPRRASNIQDQDMRAGSMGHVGQIKSHEAGVNSWRKRRGVR